MILNSPHYQGLLIYVGERPVAGSFYVPKSSDTLTNMSNWAYNGGFSGVKRINKSAWNMANCVYRKNSTKCYSAEVNSSLAVYQNSFADGAWIALCQKDKQSWAASLGLSYPVIWLPGPNGEEPEDLEMKPEIPEFSFKAEPAPTNPSKTGTFTIPGSPDLPAVQFEDPATPDSYWPDISEESKAVWPWILGGSLAAAAVIGAVVVWRRRDQ